VDVGGAEVDVVDTVVELLVVETVVDVDFVVAEVEVVLTEVAVVDAGGAVPVASPYHIPRPFVPIYTLPYLRGSAVKTLADAEPNPCAASWI